MTYKKVNVPSESTGGGWNERPCGRTERLHSIGSWWTFTRGNTKQFVILDVDRGNRQGGTHNRTGRDTWIVFDRLDLITLETDQINDTFKRSLAQFRVWIVGTVHYLPRFARLKFRY